jgi:hypothetical protein
VPPPVYVAPGIAAVREIWEQSGGTVDVGVTDQLDAYAEALRSGRPAARTAVAVLVQGWGLDQQLLNEPFTLDAARDIVA